MFGLHGKGSEGSKEVGEVDEEAMAASGGELELELELELERKRKEEERMRFAF